MALRRSVSSTAFVHVLVNAQIARLIDFFRSSVLFNNFFVYYVDDHDGLSECKICRNRFTNIYKIVKWIVAISTKNWQKTIFFIKTVHFQCWLVLVRSVWIKDARWNLEMPSIWMSDEKNRACCFQEINEIPSIHLQWIGFNHQVLAFSYKFPPTGDFLKLKNRFRVCRGQGCDG